MPVAARANAADTILTDKSIPVREQQVIHRFRERMKQPTSRAVTLSLIAPTKTIVFETSIVRFREECNGRTFLR